MTPMVTGFYIMFIGFIFSVGSAQAGVEELFHSVSKQEDVLVLEVISSDMIILEDGQRIKLLSIESFGPPPRPIIKYDDKGKPIEDMEMHPTISLEEQAIVFAQNLMEGKKVKLEYDVDARDEKGQKTAYIYLSDGRMANVELLRQGFVRLKVRPPNFKHKDSFKKAYQEARKEQRGFLSY